MKHLMTVRANEERPFVKIIRLGLLLAHSVASLWRRGLMATLHLAFWRLHSRYADYVEARFDRDLGVDTSGLIDTKELPWDEVAATPGVGYLGVCPLTLRRALASLKIRYADFTFIDLGSGKGRALLMAAEYGFKRIVGVELFRRFHESALENVSRLRRRGQGCQIECICQNAVDFQLPEEPMVVLFYNPFPEQVMTPVVGRLGRSLERSGKDLYVIYVRPRHGGIIEKCPFLHVWNSYRHPLKERRSYVIYRSALRDPSEVPVQGRTGQAAARATEPSLRAGEKRQP